MRVIQFKGAVLAMGMLIGACYVSICPLQTVSAQTATTGGLSGVISDASGAVVPNATVTVQNAGNGSQQVVQTNGDGRYTVSNLAPGLYKVSATTTGMQSETAQVTVLVGTTVGADIKVTPSGDKTVIEVTSTTLPLVDTENVAWLRPSMSSKSRNFPPQAAT